MKKIVLVLFVVSSFVGACKKDYTCSCTVTSSVSPQTQKKERILLDVRKSDAKKICTDYKETSNTITTTATCTLE